MIATGSTVADAQIKPSQAVKLAKTLRFLTSQFKLYVMFYPQNGDRIVTTYSVTSFDPMHSGPTVSHLNVVEPQ